jgi:two-component system cell cycle response regulator DivK
MLEREALSESVDDLTNGSKSTSATVLVVEDFDETRFMIKLSLEMSGYHVLEAVNGQEAVEIARREPLDLILIDLDSPLLDGFGAIRCLREEARLLDIPIVAVTPHATAEYRVKAFTAGCNEFVSKPINLHKLKRVLEPLLRGA